MATVLSNSEVVTAIGLPDSVLTTLQTAEGDTFSATANQFLTALVNKIVYQKVASMTFSNPFKKYDSFPVNFGDTIENIFIDKAIGVNFDKDATDPFAKTLPSAKTLYASINFERQYPVTIEDKLLRRAALNEYGFMSIINTILKSLSTAMGVEEYLATIAMLNNKEIYKDGFEEVDVSALSSEEASKAVTKKIVDVYNDFALPSIDNNKMGVLQVTEPSNCLLVIKQSLLNDINLDYLAGVYNLSKVDLIKNIIPVRSFVNVGIGIDGTAHEWLSTLSANTDDIDFIILDERGFDCHVALQDSGMIYNPRGKYTNHFTNLWKIIAYRYDYQARAFKLKTA